MQRKAAACRSADIRHPHSSGDPRFRPATRRACRWPGCCSAARNNERAAGSFLLPDHRDMQWRRGQFAVRKENACQPEIPGVPRFPGQRGSAWRVPPFPAGGISRIVIQKIGKPHDGDVLIDLQGRARSRSSRDDVENPGSLLKFALMNCAADVARSSQEGLPVTV